MVPLAGGTFYSVSVGAASGFPAGCRIKFFNADPMPTGANATGAKVLSVNGINGCMPSQASTYVWPQQYFEITNNSTATGWMISQCPGMWIVPASTFTINVDPTNGSDTWGASDGLSTSGRAFASFNNAMYVASDMMQWQFANQTNLTFLCTIAGASCSGVSDTVLLHWPPHGTPAGSEGRNSVRVNCNGGGFSQQVQLFFGAAIVDFFSCTWNAGSSASEGAEILLGDGNNVCVPNSNPCISLSSGGQFGSQSNALNLAAGSGVSILKTGAGGGHVGGTAGNLIINQTGNVTFSDAAIHIQGLGFVAIDSWTTNAHTTTGTKYLITECGIIEGSTNVQGSVAGSASCTQVN